MRSADTTHCIRARRYYDYYCYSSQSLRTDLQSLLLLFFLFVEEAETSSWWDLQDLFFITDLFQSLSNCFVPFLKQTHAALSTSQRPKCYFWVGLQAYFHFILFFCLCTPSLTKTEVNGIPFWKGMRNRCKHACIRQDILWNLFCWKSRFRKTFDAGSPLNCYQQAQQDSCPSSYINKQVSTMHK